MVTVRGKAKEKISKGTKETNGEIPPDSSNTALILVEKAARTVARHGISPSTMKWDSRAAHHLTPLTYLFPPHPVFTETGALGSCRRATCCAFAHRGTLSVWILPDFGNHRSSPAHWANHSFKETALVPVSPCSYSRDEFSLLQSNVGSFTPIAVKPL